MVFMLEQNICVGAQGGQPQIMPLRQTDDFELKLLEKQPMQEGNSDPPASPWKAGNKSHMKGALPASGRRTPLSPEVGNMVEKPV